MQSRRRACRGLAIVGLFTAVLGLVVGGCTGGHDILKPGRLVSITVHAVFAETSASYTAEPPQVDRVRVLAIRPSSSDTLDQEEATVTIGQESVPVDLSVELQEPQEQLLIQVELWSGSVLAYAGEDVMLVDASKSVNESPPISLELASPLLDVQPASLSFTLPQGDTTASQPVIVGSVGVGGLDWQVSSDVSWLGPSQSSGSLPQGDTTIVPVEASSAGLDPGTYTGTLTFTAADALRSPRTVSVTLVVEANPPPTANAGPDQTVTDADGSGDEAVRLDGSGSSDPNGSIASYVWTEGGTQIATGATPTVTLAVGTHAITLTVTDNEGATGSDQVQITVVANPPPTASAGPDQTVADSDGSGSEAVRLDGSGSSDPNGSIVSYVWTEGGTQIATGATPTVTLTVGTHGITLTVTDNEGATGSDQVQITVVANPPPTANAGPDQTVTDSDGSGSEAVRLDGSGSSDPNGSIVSYVWTEGGTQIATGATPTVTLAVGTHGITLTVTDNEGATGSDQVQITVVALPPPDLIIPTGTPSVTPASVPAGGSVTLSSWQVYNKGGSPSGPFNNGFYLSTDAVITTGDVYLGGNSNASLDPGTGFTWGGPTLTIPAGTAPGSYYIGILVDRANQVAESNEGNNAVAAGVTVIGMATLTVTIDGVGAVSSSGVTPALDCSYVEGTCSQTYPIGTVVSLTANQVNPDFSFERWLSTDGGFTCSTNPTCVVTMDRARTVTAWFPTPGMLSVNPNSAAFTMPQGGTPTPSSRAITVSDIGDRAVTGVQIRKSYASIDTTWLKATIDRTVIDTLNPGTMTLSVNPNNLEPGTYNATVYVGDFVMTVAQVAVSLTVQSLAPTISNLSINLIRVNDSANCGNGGSSYNASFRYSDADGDVTMALATIRDHYVFSTGESGTLVWPGAGYYTVGGDGFSGSISAILCTVFAGRSTTDSFTVEDGAGHLSNVISATRSPPAGANALPSGAPTAPSSAGTSGSGGGVAKTEGSKPPGS